MSELSIQTTQQGNTPRAATSPDTSTRKQRQGRMTLTGLAFLAPFLIVYTLFVVWPIILGFQMSFYNWTLGVGGTIEFLGLANYVELFGDTAFWRSLWTTIVFTLISTPVLVILALILALLVNRAIPAQGLFRTIFFAPFILPVSVVALLWSWLYQPGFGLINGTLTSLGLAEVQWLTEPTSAMIAVIILTVWWTVGFNFVLYLAGMQQIPREVVDAARIDGAGTWARIRWITIPLLNRFTVLIIILQVIASLQLFTQTYLLTSGGPNFATRSTIQYIYETGFTSFRMGFASSMSYIFFAVVLLVSLTQFGLLARQRRNA